MDRCTGRRDLTEMLLKMALNTKQSINQPLKRERKKKKTDTLDPGTSVYLFFEYISLVL